MLTTTQLLDIDWLWANKSMVHYFGLGFIQLKIDQDNRVHFYTDKLPRTVELEEIHDHRYNFVSRILQGTLDQEIFELRFSDGKPTHRLVQESCGPVKCDFESVERYCTISPVFQKLYHAGDSYFIDHNTFHRVDSNDAITHVCRGGYQKEFANVAFPIGGTTTCPFSVKVSEDDLHDIIQDILGH